MMTLDPYFGPLTVSHSHARLYIFLFRIYTRTPRYSREASTTPCICTLNSNEL